MCKFMPHKPILNNITFYLSILVVLLFLPFVHADMGPKPNVDITIYYDNTLVEGSFNAVMLQCAAPGSGSAYNMRGCDSVINPGSECQLQSLNISDNECYWAVAPLAWGGQCENGKCNFHYFPPNRFRLGIFIPMLNNTFITNAIDRNNFNSLYEVKINSNGDARIRETTFIFNADIVRSFIQAFLITVVLELIVALIFTKIHRWPNKFLWYVLLANAISLPIVWFIIPLLKINVVSSLLSFIIVAALYEAFAFIFEAYFLYWTNKEFLDLKNAFKLSVAMNVVSLILGGIAYLFIHYFFMIY